MAISDLIKHCPMFAELDNLALRELVAISRIKACSKGEMIFQEGESAAALFILVSGSVELIKSSPGGKEQFVRQIKKGETFAEAAMFAGDAYPATAIARAKSEMVMIDKKRFVAFVRAHPDIALKIMGAMAKLLRHLNSLVSDISLGSVMGRLAGFLISRSEESRGKTFELGMQKRDLAFRLGTVAETLSRNLKKLRDDEIIDVAGQRITIKDLEILKDLADR